MLHMKQHDNFRCSTNHTKFCGIVVSIVVTWTRYSQNYKAQSYYVLSWAKQTHTYSTWGSSNLYFSHVFNLPLTNIGDFLQSIIITIIIIMIIIIIIIIIKMYPITGTNDKETHWRFYMYTSTLLFLVRNCYICTEDPYCIIIYTVYVLNAY